MRLVVIESPFMGRTKEEAARNITYARAALADCLKRGEAPFASHLLYPQVLDDDVPGQRQQGIHAGFDWARHADAVVVYEDLGRSPGMRAGIARAEMTGQPIEYRSLPNWKDA